jgi:uncharacterized protein involved in type VI secretion and phage assembly
MAPAQKLFGKYRGKVVDNVDPEGLARIRVLVPDLPQTASTVWAMPCAPIAGNHMGIRATPPVGASVWVDFERGEPKSPIWSGGFWDAGTTVPGAGDDPAIATIRLQTTLQNAITISDLPGPGGGIMLKSASGANIIVNDTGITIQNGRGASIVLTGPTVTINEGALTIT